MSKDIKKISNIEQSKEKPKQYIELINEVDDLLNERAFYKGLKLLDTYETQYQDIDFKTYKRNVFEYLLYLLDPEHPLDETEKIEGFIQKKGYFELQAFLRGEKEYIVSMFHTFKSQGLSEIAMYFLENGAERDVSKAQMLLGLFHHEGRFYPQDDKQAFYWFFRSAMLNDPDGLNALGSAFYEGIGTKINYDRAFKYMVKAYKMGITQSLGDIGYMYYMGLGTQQNTQKAYDKWIEGRDKNAVGCQNYLDTYFSKLDHH